MTESRKIYAAAIALLPKIGCPECGDIDWSPRFGCSFCGAGRTVTKPLDFRHMSPDEAKAWLEKELFK